MTDRREQPPVEKRGGYSGGRPASEMGPPVHRPSPVATPTPKPAPEKNGQPPKD